MVKPLVPAKVKRKTRATPSSVIGVSLPPSMVADIERRAASMQITKTKYVSLVVQQWLDEGGKLVLSE
jgi:hypothetical protein